jgi:S1-C subfamily serine protease
MTSRLSKRLTIGVATVAAFVGGLVVAGGFNMTPFGYAQQAGATRPPAAAVQQVTDASNAFVAIAEHVTPAVVSIQMERQARPVRVPRGQQIPPGMEDFFKQFDPRQQQQQPMEGS